MTAKELGSQSAYLDDGTTNCGLTKREAFAMAAMQSVIQTGIACASTVKDAAIMMGIQPAEYNVQKHYPILVARDAVIQADALLEELAKEVA